ncbi:MAG: MotA/TolQ/ExbB proton channel family protein [Blastochloris sp.]|nr:MotA/TolQ/ExbB proton channel family protein [Blastochloris sp.]
MIVLTSGSSYATVFYALWFVSTSSSQPSSTQPHPPRHQSPAGFDDPDKFSGGGRRGGHHLHHHLFQARRQGGRHVDSTYQLHHDAYLHHSTLPHRAQAKLSPPAVVALLRDAISSGNYQQAYEICIANPCFLSKIMQASFENIGMGKHAVEEALTEAFAKQAVRLKSKNNYLSVIGVISPMIGLTGTVLGMMTAFSALGSSGVSQMGKLSSAISAVLIATAAGLIVAIPAFAFFYFFKNAMTTAFCRHPR